MAVFVTQDIIQLINHRTLGINVQVTTVSKIVKSNCLSAAFFVNLLHMILNTHSTLMCVAYYLS